MLETCCCCCCCGVEGRMMMVLIRTLTSFDMALGVSSNVLISKGNADLLQAQPANMLR